MTQHWIPAELSPGTAGSVQVVIDPSMAEDRAVAVLHVVDGPSLLTLTPERAQLLGVSSHQGIRVEDLAPRLAAAGIRLNGPDCLFYLPATDHEAVRSEPSPEGTRQLTPEDQEAFTRFTGQAPAADLDEAFVELDHWLAFGTFTGGRLVAAASMYPWRGTRLADLGVITLPADRGHGHARRVVRAISSMALQLGYEPQYRCQLSNVASAALAESAGFVRFGQWDVVEKQQDL
ncbi:MULTISPECIES: GNAT family N-acetyltransferase [unclassified Arthrobacter]|uniref:GNAT family N-acetyltransferase n=1 Tax=unclassified Arthrobacter TaxID=235627 RepID=UPI0014921AB5|nr:GNAT family protein [Arthrobacter sp. AET 35A]MBE0009386.1 GNAT family N-acetyltransferase [Arthrobacter sp. AET 35A]